MLELAFNPFEQVVGNSSKGLLVILVLLIVFSLGYYLLDKDGFTKMKTTIQDQIKTSF